jgi:hypothetical protein
MKVHESVFVTARKVFACAPQTARDPSASAGMTDNDGSFVTAIGATAHWVGLTPPLKGKLAPMGALPWADILRAVGAKQARLAASGLYRSTHLRPGRFR